MHMLEKFKLELELGLDFLSWSILKIIFTEIHLSQNSLRLFAFILYTLTCFFYLS